MTNAIAFYTKLLLFFSILAVCFFGLSNLLFEGRFYLDPSDYFFVPFFFLVEFISDWYYYFEIRKETGFELGDHLYVGSDKGFFLQSDKELEEIIAGANGYRKEFLQKVKTTKNGRTQITKGEYGSYSSLQVESTKGGFLLYPKRSYGLFGNELPMAYHWLAYVFKTNGVSPIDAPIALA